MITRRPMAHFPTGLVDQGGSRRALRRHTAVIVASSVSLVTIGVVICSLLSAPGASSISDLAGRATAVIMMMLIGLLLIYRNRMEERLLVTQEHLRLVYEQVADGLVLSDRDGICTDVNAAACRMLGDAREKLIGARFSDFLPAEEMLCFEAGKQAFVHRASPSAQITERVLRRKDGTSVTAELSAKVLSDGQWQMSIRDVSDRKRTEALLKETERRLRDMEQVARAGSWRRNVLTDELQWSDQMQRIFGFSTGDPAPSFETFLACVHPEDRPIIDRMKDQAVHSGTSEGVYRIILPDGVIRFLHEQATVDLDTEGCPIRLVGVTQDITERQTLEWQLRQTEKLAALGTLMAGVAHELNNPLFAVTGYIELMAEKVQGGRYRGPGLADDLAALSQATDRTMAIVQRFLRAARTAVPHREPIAVNALLEQALNLAANDLRISRIAVKTGFARICPPVIGDAEGLLQVCLNLFANARQSMVAAHGGGTLQVTTRLVRTPAGPRVEVRVRDDGGGIAPEHLPRIFEPFFTTKPVGEGTGLGLSLCHRIVTELGGKLSCESRPDQGAAFVVELLPAEEKVPVPPHEEDCSVAGYRSCQDSHHDG